MTDRWASAQCLYKAMLSYTLLSVDSAHKHLSRSMQLSSAPSLSLTANKTLEHSPKYKQP